MILFSLGITLKAQENPVLPTTTVTSSQPQTYVPSGRVTANEYFKMLQTTGSYGVNRERSLADQTAAISKARETKKLKEQMSRIRHYRSDFTSAQELLDSIPPPPEPTPLRIARRRRNPEFRTTGSHAPGRSWFPWTCDPRSIRRSRICARKPGADSIFREVEIETQAR